MSYKVFILIELILISGMLFGAEKYAVLITGDYADSARANYNGSWAINNNIVRDSLPMQEFWNDTFLMWEMLVFEKGYDDDNVFILFAGGIDYPIDDEANCPDWWAERYKVEESHPGYTHITDYSATIANVEMVLEGLAYGNPQENIPQLQEDDFLTIWTFDHGVLGRDEFDNDNYHVALCLLDYDWHYNPYPDSTDDIFIDPVHSIKDYELQALLNQINVQKKVIFMQQCYSGGFVPYLENENAIIYTAANDSMGAKPVDTLYFDGIDYPGDPEPGNCYGAYEMDEWFADSTVYKYRHGEYNFHLMNALKGETPVFDNFYHTEYIDFPLENADINQDDLCSIYEAKEWVDSLNSRQRLYFGSSQPSYDDPQYSDDGEIGETTSLEYPNLLSGEITQSQTITGIIAIPFDLCVNSGISLTFNDNSIIYFINQSHIIIEDNAEFIIGSNCIIYGENNENRIEVNGNIAIGNYVQFTSNEGDAWYGLYLNNCDDITLQNPTFENCNLYEGNIL